MVDSVSEEALLTIGNLTIFLYIAVVIYFFFRISLRKE